MTKMEALLIKALAETLVVREDEISITKTFDEFGIDSLYAIQFLMEVEDMGGPKIEAEWVFEHPTIQALAAYIDSEHSDWQERALVAEG